ncbi:pyridoxal kinase [Breoghania sp.]|uniref:pyridoxal kinase n=1 Tax=Breoghania sp. TaxID=2065378 RepID=UPI002601892D|nr:pyridoxal kinase [Breoghania sp.]MDJ0931627.1 pyridoxal kinase [Breoghania sp.]
MTDTPETPPSSPRPKPAVIVATSQVVRGTVGGRSSLFTLERLGFRVWHLPTILLGWNPKYGPSTRLIPDKETFAGIVDDLIGARWLGEVGAVLTGYLGAAHQGPTLGKLISAVKKQNPDALYLCDPIIGDEGTLYVPPETVAAQKNELMPRADILTPNLFELSWFTGGTIETEMAALAAARTLPADRVMVSSAPALRKKSLSTLLATPHSAFAVEHAEVDGVPHGTGDLLAALFLAELLQGSDDETALARTVSGTFEMAARSAKAGSDEQMLTEYQQTIVRPMAMVTSRRIMERRERV